MISAWLIVSASLLLRQLPPGDRARELVSRLGSDQYIEREAATKALEAIGPAALPALHAVGSSRDPELRTRAAAIVAKLESRELSSASMISLDVVDMPLDEVIDRIGGRSPSRLAWHPSAPMATSSRRVTIHEKAPIPFWTAIDRLCQAGDLHYIPGSPGGPGDGRLPEYRMFLAPGTMICPRADHGPLRLEIVALSHSRHVNLIPGPKGEEFGRRFRPREFGRREEEFMARMRILAEPRMLMNQVGGALIAEAVDDRGQSLLPSPTPFYYGYGYGHGDTFACGDYVVKFNHPKAAGKVIKRLKLTIPVEVLTLNPGRLEIPLEDAVGKTFPHGKESIEILSIGRNPQGAEELKLRITTRVMVPESLKLDGAGNLEPVASRPAQPAVTPDVIQILDNEGRQFPWYLGDNRHEGTARTAILSLNPAVGIPIPVRVGKGLVPPSAGKSAVPAVLYHTETARGVILATFEFTDIPLP